MYTPKVTAKAPNHSTPIKQLKVIAQRHRNIVAQFAMAGIGVLASVVEAAPLTNAISVTTGPSHSCVIASGARTYCWGSNRSGETGDGTLSINVYAVPAIASKSESLMIGLGSAVTLQMSPSGQVVEWGRYKGPALTEYVQSGAISLAVGETHHCVLLTGGQVKCWAYSGDAFYKELGGAVSGGTPIGLDANVTAISAGSDHTCAIMVTGEVRCWGRNTQGQSGTGTTSMFVATPTAVPNLPGAVQSIAAGQHNTCLLLTSGAVYCIGDNSSGQIGDNTTLPRLTPAQVSGLPDAAAEVAVGDFHACARTVAGAVYCWGRNEVGQLGDGTNITRTVPVLVSGLDSGVISLSTRGYHNCAVLASGQVRCWGSNINAQLGDGTRTDRNQPVTVQLAPVDGRKPHDLAGSNSPDIIWRHSTNGTQLLWKMTGAVRDAESSLPIAPLSLRVAGVADVNRDGVNDLVMHDQATGDVTVWIMQNGIPSSVLYVENISTQWVLESVADFNGDGAPDLLWRNSSSGAAYVWYLDGLRFVSDQFLFAFDPAWQVVGTGDFTQDGTPDLLFRHAVTGLAFSWNTAFNGSTLSLTDSSPPIFSISPTWQVAQVADWNGDGKPDILFRNVNTGLVFAWHLNGSTLTTSEYITQIDPVWIMVPTR